MALRSSHLLTHQSLHSHSLSMLMFTQELGSPCHTGNLVGSQKPSPNPATSVVEAQLMGMVNDCPKSTVCCWEQGLPCKKSLKACGAFSALYFLWHVCRAQPDKFFSMAGSGQGSGNTRACSPRCGQNSCRKMWKLSFFPI